MNRVVCCVERSRNRHLFALVLLSTVLIIKEVSGYFALGRLACDQGILSVLELRNLARECLVLLLVLLPLPLLRRGVATLGSQAGGESAEGRRQNERLSRMIAPFHYLPPLFRFICNLDKAIALAAKVKRGRRYLPLQKHRFCTGLLALLSHPNRDLHPYTVRAREVRHRGAHSNSCKLVANLGGDAVLELRPRCRSLARNTDSSGFSVWI